jgi:hypothetical protein
MNQNNYMILHVALIVMNGVRYHIKEYAETRITQNNGIFVSGDNGNSVTEYCGELKNILELRYPS